MCDFFEKETVMGRTARCLFLCVPCVSTTACDVSKQKVFEDTRSVARGGGKDGIVVGNISPRSGHQVILFVLTFDFSQPGS